LIRTSTIAPFGFCRDLHRGRQLVTPAWVAGLVAGAPLVAAPARADGALVSTRSWNEFIGHTSGYSHIEAKGDIANPVVRRVDAVDTTVLASANWSSSGGVVRVTETYIVSLRNV
jgi:hypothetical protein